eukprot:3324144-Pyramimonas_sp.AAC.1
MSHASTGDQSVWRKSPTRCACSKAPTPGGGVLFKALGVKLLVGGPRSEVKRTRRQGVVAMCTLVFRSVSSSKDGCSISYIAYDQEGGHGGAAH